MLELVSTIHSKKKNIMVSSNTITFFFTIQIMAVRKKKETEMDNFLAPCSHKEGHPASQVNLSNHLYKKKVEPLGTSQQHSSTL